MKMILHMQKLQEGAEMHNEDSADAVTAGRC